MKRIGGEERGEEISRLISGGRRGEGGPRPFSSKCHLLRLSTMDYTTYILGKMSLYSTDSLKRIGLAYLVLFDYVLKKKMPGLFFTVDEVKSKIQ
jgi:hypothetical protein